MLKIDGYANTVRNIYRLTQPYQREDLVTRVHDMKPGLLSFYEYYLPDTPVNRTPDVFITEEHVELGLGRAFATSNLDDLQQDKALGSAYAPPAKEAKIRLARQALDQLFDRSPDFGDIFTTVIHSVFFRQNNPNSPPSAGGSTSGALGAIWLSGADELTIDDYMELFVHELTHHLIFIDELNAPQFNYDVIANREYFTRSAILQIDRPIDKVLHSIIVATELVANRSNLLSGDNCTVHPTTDAMAAETIAACEAVLNLEGVNIVLRPRGRELVERCLRICRNAIEDESASLAAVAG